MQSPVNTAKKAVAYYGMNILDYGQYRPAPGKLGAADRQRNQSACFTVSADGL